MNPRLEQFLLTLSKSPAIDAGDFAQAIRLALDCALDGLQIKRAGVWLLSDDRRAICCELTIDRHHHLEIDNFRINDQQYPDYFRHLHQDRVIKAHDAQHDPATHEFREAYLIPFGITSMLDAPIRHHGVMIGILCCEHIGPKREWTQDEGSFVGALADLIGRALNAQLLKHALDQQQDINHELEKLSLVASHTSDAVVIANAQGIVEWVNPAYEALTGYSLSEMKGKKPGRMLQGPDTSSEHQGAIREGLKSGQPFTQEILNYSKSRQTYWVEIQITPLFDSTGVLARYIAIERNITPRKRYIQSLEKLHRINASSLPFEQQIQRLLRCACDIFQLPIAFISRLDEQYCYIEHVVDPFKKISRGMQLRTQDTYCFYTVEQNKPLGVCHVGKTPMADLPCYQQFNFETYLGTPITLDGVAYGILSFVGLKPRKTDFASEEFELLKLFAQSIAHEIQRNQTAKALQKEVIQREELAARLAVATEGTGVGIWELNLKTGQLVWDPTMYRLLGVDPADFTGVYQYWENCLHPEDVKAAVAAFQRSLNQREKFNTEFRIVWPSGEIRWIKAIAVLTVDEQGRLDSMIGTNWDITPLVQAREQAEAANQAKSAFLANMSHEIRTPMNGVLGMLDLVGRTPLSSLQKNYVNLAQSSAKSLLNLINDILDFSKIEAGQMVLETINFDIRQQLFDFAESMVYRIEEKGLEFIIQIDENIPDKLKGDPSRLRQILINLVGNAVKFTQKGSIGVYVTLLQQPAPAGNVVLNFQITDTGIGIPEHKIPHLFEMFSQVDASTTRQYGGTGLGLSIVKQLCQLMQGDVQVSSVVNEGSCFEFVVQLQLGDASIAEDSIAPHLVIPRMTQPVAASQIRLLLVEDNAINQLVAQGMLEAMGYHVDLAGNGVEALQALEFAAQTQPYHLILMDCQMPEMDGYEASMAIRSGKVKIPNPDLPIIALTANAMKGDRERCLASGMSDYLAKPIEPEQLEIKLKQWLLILAY